jgi:hypothetical protein
LPTQLRTRICEVVQNLHLFLLVFLCATSWHSDVDRTFGIRSLLGVAPGWLGNPARRQPGVVRSSSDPLGSTSISFWGRPAVPSKTRQTFALS